MTQEEMKDGHSQLSLILAMLAMIVLAVVLGIISFLEVLTLQHFLSLIL